jgi:ubiquinone/menaquinone biosynthesis C-methylase UbiE
MIGLAALLVAGFLLDRELYFYEGAHLGPRVQAWLYNRWAKKYEDGKRASQLQDDEMLAQPLLDAFCAVDQPFILDFAAGTGRLSEALLRRREFTGHIIAPDLSLAMLEQAAMKLSRRLSPAVAEHSSATVEFLRHGSLPLPFPDATFDAVCALEVLELFPDMEKPLQEFSRVLRPGGILLTSRGTEQSGRKAKVKSKRELSARLEGNGFE